MRNERRISELDALQRMGDTDTALGGAASLRQAQASTGQAGIVMDGFQVLHCVNFPLFKLIHIFLIDDNPTITLQKKKKQEKRAFCGTGGDLKRRK